MLSRSLGFSPNFLVDRNYSVINWCWSQKFVELVSNSQIQRPYIQCQTSGKKEKNCKTIEHLGVRQSPVGDLICHHHWPWKISSVHPLILSCQSCWETHHLQLKAPYTCCFIRYSQFASAVLYVFSQSLESLWWSESLDVMREQPLNGPVSDFSLLTSATCSVIHSSFSFVQFPSTFMHSFYFAARLIIHVLYML